MGNFGRLLNKILDISNKQLDGKQSLDSAIEYAEKCKPLLKELKKETPWPFGKAYQDMCRNVIGTALTTVDTALYYMQVNIDKGSRHWSQEKDKDKISYNNNMNPINLKKLQEILESFEPNEENREILVKVISVLTAKQIMIYSNELKDIGI